ncbi:MAG: hypothetical protein A3A97_01995 [Candidatus Terrybacteria bacterium RIFCSPLOWO2_01_FULL_40_23]|uniref:Uncharacterized protein n=1 Tax=Candidatus Terrybacteria bacterium RIFCSPLOWO2_01_FULL_40_23 TaxID=1802366 RepID=A0A1G2PQU3_9BACT|nr:MAG: hypothetical protein A3A97_01995 [Candidatus Terrybacteria bacterium RIFCSPLOWO2_01_FULL_40_23]
MIMIPAVIGVATPYGGATRSTRYRRSKFKVKNFVYNTLRLRQLPSLKIIYRDTGNRRENHERDDKNNRSDYKPTV